MSDVPDIKLIRTDTTLDLSHQAEKRCCCNCSLLVVLFASTSLVVYSMFRFLQDTVRVPGYPLLTVRVLTLLKGMAKDPGQEPLMFNVTCPFFEAFINESHCYRNVDFYPIQTYDTYTHFIQFTGTHSSHLSRQCTLITMCRHDLLCMHVYTHPLI